jgi:hypothetical protein
MGGPSERTWPEPPKCARTALAAEDCGGIRGDTYCRATGWRVEELNEEIDQDIAQPPEIGDRDRVLEPREGRLAGEVGILGKPIGDELEDGIGPQGVVIVLVFVIGEDAIDPLSHHAQQGLLGEEGIASVVESGCDLLGELGPLVELADR